MGFVTALAIAQTVKSEKDAHDIRKKERKFTAQAKAEALEERKSTIDAQRQQLGVGGTYKTKQTSTGSFANQTGEVLG